MCTKSELIWSIRFDERGDARGRKLVDVCYWYGERGGILKCRAHLLLCYGILFYDSDHLSPEAYNLFSLYRNSRFESPGNPSLHLYDSFAERKLVVKNIENDLAANFRLLLVVAHGC